jgi:hypothetical protein
MAAAHFSPLTTSGFICHLNKVSSKPAAAHISQSPAEREARRLLMLGQ